MTVLSLIEQVERDGKRKQVIEDALRILDAEVADKSGLSGLAVQGAYRVVKGISPGFLTQVVDHLLEDFLRALDPVYQEALEKGASPGPYLVQQSSRVADGLLAVTDQRAQRSGRAVVKKTYEKLRPTAKRHVEAAMPRLGDLLERHAQRQVDGTPQS
jgi:hypothetical protein